jgi:hypothetical protein
MNNPHTSIVGRFASIVFLPRCPASGLTASSVARTVRRVALCFCTILYACVAWMDLPVTRAEEIDFQNDVVPILTKAGCNMGICHAKAGGGQNGFELSLLGFEPDQDFHRIVWEGRGRRVLLAAPEQSLLVRKAIGLDSHGGGARFDIASPHYQVLVEWIRRGCPPTSDTAATLQDVQVNPVAAKLTADSPYRVHVTAVYSDGSRRDVSQLALFESNRPEVAVVDQTGTVKAGVLPGRAAIMVRYQGRIAVHEASLPLGPELEDLPIADNPVDQWVFEDLRRLGIPPSPLCDDATFLRRVTLDLAGRLPSATERERYWATAESDRRQQLIEALLETQDFADYFANKWTSLLKNRRDDASDMAANFAFHSWIRDHLLTGTPYDQMVRQLLAATGTIISNPAVAWYKRVKDPKEQLEDVSQLFLGVRLQCAQCHHHPFERWSQDDYYALGAFFSRVGRKPTGVREEDMIFHQRGKAEAQNVTTGAMLRPRALGMEVGDIDPSEDPRLRLADWMSSPDNPFFAKALVNRYWKHFFGVGLIEPEDDIRDSNPAANPQLLAAIEQAFISSGFNQKQLIRTLVMSRAYQLSSEVNSMNGLDTRSHSRFYPRRLPAEVLLDAIDQLLGSQTHFANLPAGTRAIALPDNSYNRSVPFLKVFGRPENSSVCECERVRSANLTQSLHLLNAADIKAKLAVDGGLADRLSQSDQPLELRVEEIYQRAFSRAPRSNELEIALNFLAEGPAPRQDFEDLLWAIINTKEFMFNH